MLKVCICEDQVKDRAMIVKILKNIIFIEDYDMDLVLETADPYSIIDYLNINKITGLYFLDIDLKTDMNGIELAKEIRKRDPRGFIVFITNNPDMCIDSFRYRIEAMDFIPKSEIMRDTKRLYKCIQDAFEKYTNTNTTLQKVLSVKVNGRIINIPFDEIIYIETTEFKHKLRICCEDRVVEFYGNMSGVYELLDETFIKAHRSYICNLNLIREISLTNGEAIMSNGDVCLISKRGAKKYQTYLK